MAYNFNSNIGQFFRLDNFTSLTMPFTMTARCRILTVKNNDIVGMQIFNTGYGYSLGVSNTNAPFLTTVVNGTSQFFGASNIVSTGVWTHVACVFASTTSRIIYTDNSISSSTASFTSPGTVTDVSVGASMYTGTNGNSRSAADIADVGIWRVSLNAFEIRSLVAGASPSIVRPQSLAFYAPLIRDATDMKTGLPLVSASAPTVVDHPRVYL